MLSTSLLISELVAAMACMVPEPQMIQEAESSRLRAWKVHVEMEKSSPYRELAWQPLGPKFAGGRIESIDAIPGQPDVIYAGVGAGGIWKTINGGLHWRQVFGKESTFAIGDLTIAPSNPEIVWVGTGETHLSGSSYSGTGVFKSVDGGRTWTNMGLWESHHIGKVLIHPTDPEVVYVAAMGPISGSGGQRGVFKTVDGGKSFEQVLQVNGQTACVDLAMDPRDSDRLFVTTWDRLNRKESGVLRSLDAGASWQKLQTGLLRENVGRVALDISLSEPDVLYVLMVDHSPPGDGRKGVGGVLFRTSDGGQNWSRTHEGYLPTYVGWDFCDVRVSPDDSQEVYICGLRLLRSEDGGVSFERGGEEVWRLHPHQGEGMHLDMHDLWIDPAHPQRLILGNDGGLYISWDRARTWLHLNNLPIAEFYRVQLDEETPFQIWGGTQDNASFVGPATARYRIGKKDSWQQVFLDPWAGGDGFSTFPDPFQSDLVYFTQQLGDLKRTRRGEIRRAKPIRPRARKGESDLQWAWDTPFAASRHVEGRLYCAAQRVLRSENRGDAWESISEDLGNRPLLAFEESPVDLQRLAVGGFSGRLHLSQDGGTTWLAAGEGLPQARIRDVTLSAHDSEVVYVVLSNGPHGDHGMHAYKSTDFGRTWISTAKHLPQEPANVIAEDPRNAACLYLGTDLGVYVSTDYGENWDSLSATLPTAAVVDLAVHSREPVVVAVTHGLSAFMLDIQSIRQAK